MLLILWISLSHSIRGPLKRRNLALRWLQELTDILPGCSRRSSGFRAVMHINSPLINVSSNVAKKRRARGGECMQRGEKRREDIHVGETEGERHTEQKIGGTFGRVLQRPHALLGDFWCAATTDAKVSPLFTQRATCVTGRDVLPIPWYACISTLTYAHNSHFRLTQWYTHWEAHSVTDPHTHSAHDRWVWQLLAVWRNSQENLWSQRHNPERGCGAGAPVGAMITLCD